MLEVGNKAPGFSLPSYLGDTVSLESFLGKSLVLYFYPKDDTPGCTKEACAFRDAFQEYQKRNIVVLGVSADGPDAHKRFVEKYHLPFLLLSDEKTDVCQLYGVWKEKYNFGKKYLGIERTTFLINPHGIILRIFKRVKVNGHADAILRVFDSVE